MCKEKKITQTTRTSGRIGGLKNTLIPPPSSRRHSGRKRVRTSSLICPPQTLDQDACLKNQRSNRKAITPATHQQRADSNTITSRLLWPAADKCAAGRRAGRGGSRGRVGWRRGSVVQLHPAERNFSRCIWSVRRRAGGGHLNTLRSGFSA